MPRCMIQRLARAFLVVAVIALGVPVSYAGGLRPQRAKHAMVVSVHELASQTGVDIMKQGGNAIDAAVATGFALAVVHPVAGNIGGGGFMLIRLSNGDTVFLDYREKAPARASEKMYQDQSGQVIPELSRLGPLAVGVPGSVMGMTYAQEHFGRFSLQRVMAPAIRLARDGFALSDGDARSMSGDRALAQYPESRRIFQNGGKGWRQGDIFRQPELARTLERIAANPRDFYVGRMARQIAASIAAGGGLITEEDLANYEVKVRMPIRGTYRGLEIISAPPPSSGGVALIETLNILEGYDLKALGLHSAAMIHLVSEAYRRAFYDRATFMGDPDGTFVPVEALIDKQYATAWRRSVDARRVSPSLELTGPRGFSDLERAAEISMESPPRESPQTTHYSVVDAAGTAVAVTTTLNHGYGSRVTVGPLGFLLNNEMDDFSAKPGTPNMFGLIQGPANSVGPNKRPLSSMTPTIVLKDGKLLLVLGTPGGPMIITTVANILIGVADFGLDIQRAVDMPRFHHQWLPDRIHLEPHRFSPDTTNLLEAAGHQLTWGDIGDGECIAIDLQTGDRLGASDSRNENGKAIGY